ncbi:MAG: DEAD/DEAH box helicase family protein [Phycisphaeraceae bacterium]|nr:DEAD/DEAH box helicase family protein [Phycisphaeraceae bacterium]
MKYAAAESWPRRFSYSQEQIGVNNEVINEGLRPPQLGALFAIGAHWSLHSNAATVVMPTGTGKTETMLATLVAFNPGTVLVVVPSDALRHQTAKKFLSLGLLYKLRLIPADCSRPVVGIITSRPRSADDLAIFDECNVIIGTASSLGQGTAVALGPQIAAKTDCLIVDEAHHVAARTWSDFRRHFDGRRVLQFTATPFRRDGKLLDGDVIYTYPLRRAQEDKYFKPISFEPVWELDPLRSDETIARAAVERLRRDRGRNLNHLVMARCESIPRAIEVHRIYSTLAPETFPILVHSESRTAGLDLARLRANQSQIVVCVDMLGEGFDLPQLKIAAIHDTHKSLAVLLQFAGRFTRVAGLDIGDATAIANIANQEVSSALERLYSEDADWNHLLSEASSEAVQEHAELIQFLRNSTRLDEAGSHNALPISSSLLRPKFSVAVYRATDFQPKQFFHAIADTQHVAAAWLNERSGTLYYVTRSESSVQWSRSKELRDRQWDLYIVHHDAARELVYIHSSDKSTLHEALAMAVTNNTATLVSGDQVFRAMGHIARLKFQNIGVKKHGRRNLRYAMYTGADVAEALSVSQRAGSIKANLSGTGFRNGKQVSIGCSYKGRVWSKDQGPIRKFISWSEEVGQLLLDQTIATDSIIQNVLIPKELTSLPDRVVLTVEWPHELLAQSEDRVLISDGTTEVTQSLVELRFERSDVPENAIHFTVSGGALTAEYALIVGGPGGYRIEHKAGPALRLRVGRLDALLEEYLGGYPPLIMFVDMAELDGNLLYEPTQTRELTLPPDCFEPWDWAGVDIRKESMWRDGRIRLDSIQAKVAEHYRAGGFAIVFDDDASGEAADLVCVKEEADRVRLALIHCKFTTHTDAGERVKDVVEVCSQAVRSGKWVADFKRLCRHVTDRETRLRSPERPTRFVTGSAAQLSSILKASRFKPVRTEIVIAQPGLSQRDCTPEQIAVLAAAHSYLLETVAVPLDIVCSN